MRMRAVVAAVLSAAAVASACTNGSDHGTAPTSSPAVNATTAPLLPTDALALPTMDFDTFQQLLGQLRGTPVVVNIWGSWCGPCREEGPRLARAARMFEDRIQFVGVDISDTRDAARSFILEMGWTYPSVFDPPEDIKTGFGFLGQPDTLFFDASGERVDVSSGPTTEERLQEGIQKILVP